jgi:cytoskeleton protein RodZ
VSRLPTIGEALRSAREAQGKSVQEASAATRIRASYLQALEEDHFERLGGHVYAKGFLRSYASWLGVDPAPLLDAYRAQEQPPVPRAPRPVSVDLNRRGPSWVAIGIVCCSIILGWALWLLVRPEPAKAPPAPFAASATTAGPATTPPSEPTATTAAPPAASSRPVTVLVRYLAASWTSVRADGRVVFRGTVDAGQTRTFTGGQTVDLLLGNPRGVQLTVNGTVLGTPPTSGVWRHLFKPGPPGSLAG